MGKNGLIIGAIIIVILLAGGGFLLMKKGQKSASETKTPQAVSPTANPNIFSSIQDALARSLSLECSFTITDTGVSTHAFIKNGMVRADVTGKTAAQNSSVIMRDKKIYIWSQNSAMMMDVPEISVTPAAGSNLSGQNMMANLEQYRQQCHVAAVADSEFDLPTGVKFKDMSQMMKAVPSGTVPSGAVPTGVNPTTYQEMMKKYQNPSQ